MTTLRDDLVATLQQENDALRERIKHLEMLCGASFAAPPHLGLTYAEARFFGMLLKLPLVRRDAVMTELYGLRPDGEEPEPKIVDVFACKLRKKLKPYGVAINVQWGQGYFLTPASKAAAMAQLERWHAAA